MSEVWIILIHIHVYKKDEKRTLKLLSMNCAGWNLHKTLKI